LVQFFGTSRLPALSLSDITVLDEGTIMDKTKGLGNIRPLERGHKKHAHLQGLILAESHHLTRLIKMNLPDFIIFSDLRRH
jgi:hypothetical protein